MLIAYLSGAFIFGLIVGMISAKRADYHTINTELQRKIYGAEQNYFGLSQWFKAVIKQNGGSIKVQDKFMSVGPTYFKIVCKRDGQDLSFTIVTLEAIDVSGDGKKWRDHYDVPVPRIIVDRKE